MDRTIPRFASPTFTDWFRARAPGRLGPGRRHDGSPIVTNGELPRFIAESYSPPSAARTARDAPFVTDRVLLWPDTFNNYLESSVLQAAVEVLEHAGYLVEIPPRPLCCGRPLYDFGMLDTAERLWRQTLRTLRPWIRAGVPVVGLEPSCVAAFRDELINLFPHDDDAAAPLPADAAALGIPGASALPAATAPRSGARARALPPQGGARHGRGGCAAQAPRSGPRGHRLGLLRHGRLVRVRGRELRGLDARRRTRPAPAVRELDADQVVVTDGFSCREQIEQSSGRAPVHIAELLRARSRVKATADRRNTRGTTPPELEGHRTEKWSKTAASRSTHSTEELIASSTRPTPASAARSSARRKHPVPASSNVSKPEQSMTSRRGSARWPRRRSRRTLETPGAEPTAELQEDVFTCVDDEDGELGRSRARPAPVPVR